MSRTADFLPARRSASYVTPSLVAFEAMLCETERVVSLRALRSAEATRPGSDLILRTVESCEKGVLLLFAGRGGSERGGRGVSGGGG